MLPTILTFALGAVVVLDTAINNDYQDIETIRTIAFLMMLGSIISSFFF